MLPAGPPSHARQVKDDDPDKKGYPGPPGWALGVGPTTPHRKTRHVKETETKQNRMDFQKNTFSMKRTTRIGCWNVRTVREEGKLTAKYALDWNPKGKRRGGRPKKTWKRTVEEEARDEGKDGRKWRLWLRMKWDGEALSRPCAPPRSKRIGWLWWWWWTCILLDNIDTFINTFGLLKGTYTNWSHLDT